MIPFAAIWEAAKLLFGGWFKSLASIASAIPPKVWYGIAVAAALLVGWHVHSVKERAAFRAAYNTGFNVQWSRTQAEITKNHINMASVAELEHDLADKNSESEARAKALADSKTSDVANQKRFADLRKADADKTETLKGIRDGALAKPTCKVPDAQITAMDGI